MDYSTIKALLICFGCSFWGFISCTRNDDEESIAKKTKHQFLSRYISFEEEFRIGESKNRDKYTFAKIVDIKVGLNGDIFVLDEMDLTIKVFDSRGNFKKSIGRKGSGPGEMQLPSGISLDSKGKLLLGDRILNRITIFKENGDFEGTIKLRDFPSFHKIAISTAENFYLTSLHGGWIIHKFNMDGVLRNSFCKAYPDNNLLIQDFFINGVLCVGRNDSVYYFPDGENEIRVFNNAGILIETLVRIGEYTPIKYEKLASGGVQFSFAEGFRHFSFPVSLHIHPRGILISQLGHGDSRSDPRKVVTEIHYIINKASYTISDSLPTIGNIDPNGNVYCFQNYPIPQVIKFSTIVH